MKRSILSAVFLSLTVGIIGCHSNATYLNVPLEYRPGSDNGSASFTLPPSKIYIATVVDKRSNTTEIGENREEDKAKPIYALDPQPADFVRKVLIDELRNDGANVVDTPDAADRIVNIELQRFWVTEMDQYEAQVTLSAQVTDKSGTALVTGVVARGEDSTFGRSLSPENYQQVLSNSTSQALDHLLGNSDFIKALSTGNGG